jgi:two-component sensor histidine kinase
VDREGRHFIGIIQDVTRRKKTEKRMTTLMRELAHRVKNQYAVILAMIRETNNQAKSPQEFETLIRERIIALSRSHDLLVHGEWEASRPAWAHHRSSRQFRRQGSARDKGTGSPALTHGRPISRNGLS